MLSKRTFMIKKLLGALTILILLFGCGGEGGIDYGDLESGGGSLIDFSDFDPIINSVNISNMCDEESDEYEVRSIYLLCDPFKELDYINNPPEICEEITIVDGNNTTQTGLYVSITAHKDCE